MKKNVQLIILGIASLLVGTGWAGSLAEWSTAGLSGGFAANPSWHTQSAAAELNGDISVVKLDETRFSSSYYANTLKMTYQLMNNSTMDLSKYVQVFAAPNAGYQMSLTNLSFNLYSVSTGAKKVAVRSSIDNFASDLMTADLVLGANNRFNVALDSSFAHVNTAVEFRIYIWSSTGYQVACLIDDAQANAVRLDGFFETLYCGFYRGTNVASGLYTFTDLAHPLATATRIGTWPFPSANWQGMGFDGTSYYMFGRSTAYGGPGLHKYDGDTALPLISGTNTFADWHGISFCNEVYYGLYHGAGQSGKGLYMFTDPADPFGTGIRLFTNQTFTTSVWNDIAFDGQRYLFVRKDVGGEPDGIYQYNPANNTFTLVSGTETYADWEGLGVYDANIVPQPGKKVYVLLFGGQSNAEGWGYHQYLVESSNPLASPRSDIDCFYQIAGTGYLPENTLLPLRSGTGRLPALPSGYYPSPTNVPVNRFGPELNFAATVRDGIADSVNINVAAIKFAYAGSSLFGTNDWLPDGTADRAADARLYRIFQETAWRGIAALRNKYPFHQVEVIGMGWVQGESDALAGQGAEYAANLTTLIQDVRLTFNPNLTFVLSKLSPNQIAGTSDTNKLTQWALVTAAQEAVAAADTNVTATATTGSLYGTAISGDAGQLHYTSASLLQIGEDLGVGLLLTRDMD